MMKNNSVKKIPILLVFDLDHTIINLNTDMELVNLMKKRNPEKVKERKHQDNWSLYMHNIFEIFHQQNFQVEEIKKIINSLELNKGFKELFEFINLKKESFEVIIFSGCNTIFVEWVIKNHKIDHIIRKFYSNKAEITNEGRINVDKTHEHDCENCEVSQCKQRLFKDYLTERSNEFVEFEEIVFIGDGGNDFCLAKFLKGSNLVCYREGYVLERLIDKFTENGNKEFTCDLLKWNDGFEIIEKIKNILV